MNRYDAERRGRRGEVIAAWWLRLRGWRILAWRVRLRVGEVDLVARRGKTLAFVEVKTRRRARDLDDAIDHHRLKRVAAAASRLVADYGRPDDDTRIDVILIAPWRWPRHLTNVWSG